MNFWNTLGITLLALALAFGVSYWFKLMFKKLFPNFKNVLKYKVFRFKKNQDMVDIAEEFTRNKIEGDKAYKILLCNNIRPTKAKEIIYIQKLLKGN